MCQTSHSKKPECQCIKKTILMIDEITLKLTNSAICWTAQYYFTYLFVIQTRTNMASANIN